MEGSQDNRHRVITPDDYTVEDRGYDTPCWVWRHPTWHLRGYGSLVVRGKRMYAHRAMWEQDGRTLAKGLVLDHLCRVTSCVRPDHLEQVTQRVNSQRGRRAKMTSDTMDAIRTLSDSGFSHRQIAAKVGIGKTSVGYFLSGRTWQDH